MPELDEIFYYFTTSKVIGDFIVDVLESWWLEHHKRFPQVKTLLLDRQEVTQIPTTTSDSTR